VTLDVRHVIPLPNIRNYAGYVASLPAKVFQYCWGQIAKVSAATLQQMLIFFRFKWHVLIQ
jgi:hypothetical protein